MGATVTSFYFLCFLLGIIAIYYIVPRRFQWIVLLVSSIAYYLLSGNGILIVYPFLTVLIAFFGTKSMDKGKAIFPITVIGILLPLLTLKYFNFGAWYVPLGVSFYTFAILSYVIDVHNQIATPQKNPLKLYSFGLYFPIVISGPIMKYREDGEQFFEGHKFDYHNLTFGAQRMLWGFFKTLVISERARQVVDTVYNNYESYSGINVIYATVCFAVELYTNFSGCMDIVLGISEIFGMKLPENFDRPYFSKTVSEYWRRWHITLGVWMKEYVFYPLLRTRVFMNMQSKLKEKHGKKKAKQLTTFTAMFILWFTVGAWHGGDWKFVIGSGLLHWFYIVMEELLEPVCASAMSKMHIDPKAKWVDCIRVVRTFILVCIGFVFFRAESTVAAGKMLVSIFGNFGLVAFFTGDVFSLGLDLSETIIFAISIIVLILVSVMQDKGSLRERIDAKKLPVRWCVWLLLLFATIIFGYYGPGFSAAEFIYQGF